MYNQERMVTLAVLTQQGQKQQVDLTWENAGISFNQEYHPYSNLKFEVGGSNNSLLFIQLPKDQTLYVELTSENRKLLHKVQSQNELFKTLFNGQRKQQAFDVAAVALFLTIIGLIIYFRGPIFSKLAYLIPTSLEKTIGDKIFKSEAKDQFIKQKEAEVKLLELVKNIKSFDESKYTVHLSAKPELNAYASLGGHIFVNLGLLKKLQTPEELLGVIGHEMIHARNRHVLKSLFQSLGVFVIFQALLGDISGIAAVIVDGGSPLLNLSYSRELESEADRESVQILSESEINPAGLISALNIIDEEFKKIKAEMPGGDILDKIEKQNFLRSHPVTQDRGLEIQKQIDKLGKNIKYKDLNLQWKALKSATIDL